MKVVLEDWKATIRPCATPLEGSSVAQCLDGLPSDGEPAYPRNKYDLKPLIKMAQPPNENVIRKT